MDVDADRHFLDVSLACPPHCGLEFYRRRFSFGGVAFDDYLVVYYVYELARSSAKRLVKQPQRDL